jgi:hypothetical protein
MTFKQWLLYSKWRHLHMIRMPDPRLARAHRDYQFAQRRVKLQAHDPFSQAKETTKL